ncbi:MAG: hypothetical protein KA760_14895 [Steroidobacteraceae bacterium]|nr:hypothetical protein [Steroidobacteraceae bacterium]
MCPLTDAEIKTRGEELARAIKARDEADGQRKAAAEQVKVHQESIDRLKSAILYKQEQRDVPCRQTADVEHLAVDITRNDTGEFVRRRELELFERQPTLGFTVEVKEDPPEKQ